MRGNSKGLVLFSVLILLLSSMSLAQVDQGRIGGIVKDSTGAVIPGVTITATNEKTGEQRTASTDDIGGFLITALKPSSYTVKAELPGFAPAQTTALQLVVGQRINVDLTIKPASVSESVMVETTAEAAVDTSSAAIGAKIGRSHV